MLILKDENTGNFMFSQSLPDEVGKFTLMGEISEDTYKKINGDMLALQSTGKTATILNVKEHPASGTVTIFFEHAGGQIHYTCKNFNSDFGRRG